MEKYVPDLYQKNIFEINYKNLSSRGIKFLIFDLDNTIALITDRHASEEAIKLFEKLKKKFKIMIASNSIGVRVKVFATELGIDYRSNCRKPKAKELEQFVLNSGYK
jgi:HAD superfamily phosphatase (TIGR01668 family)